MPAFNHDHVHAKQLGADLDFLARFCPAAQNAVAGLALREKQTANGTRIDAKQRQQTAE